MQDNAGEPAQPDTSASSGGWARSNVTERTVDDDMEPVKMQAKDHGPASNHNRFDRRIDGSYN